MADVKLETLKDLPVPAPTENAKKLALAAALDAFDGAACDTEAEKKADDASKASQSGNRLNSASQSGMRRRPMSITRFHYGMAASVAALAIAAPAAFQALRQSTAKHPVASARVEQAPIEHKFAEPPAPAPRRSEIAAPPPAPAEPTMAARPAELQRATADTLAPPPPPAAPVTSAPPSPTEMSDAARVRAIRDAEVRAQAERKSAATGFREER